MTEKLSANKLNEAYRLEPETVLNLLFHRIPMPESLNELLPVRPDGTISALGLFNNCVLTSNHVVATLSDPDVNSAPTTETCTGFELTSFSPDEALQQRIPEHVPVYLMSKDLFDALWDLLPLASEEVQQQISDMANVYNEQKLKDPHDFVKRVRPTHAPRIVSPEEEYAQLLKSLRQIQEAVISKDIKQELLADKIVDTVSTRDTEQEALADDLISNDYD